MGVRNMSKIHDLIFKLCPNGVEFKRIKDEFVRIKGTPITAEKMKEIGNLNGEVRVFAGGKTVINAFESDIPNANITRVPAVLVQSRGVIDFIYYNEPFTFKNEMWAYTSDNWLKVKFLYYVLKDNSQYFRDQASGMGSLPQISLPVTENFRIPVPPIEIQQEIVRILDTFTTLEAELGAELEARKIQYEFYRDSVFSSYSIENILTLSDMCSYISDGSHYSPKSVVQGYFMPSVKDMRTSGFDFSECKRISEKDYLALVRNGCRPEKGDVLVAKDGSMLKYVFVMEDSMDIVLLSSIAILRPNPNIINPYFLSHYFRQSHFKEIVINEHSSKGGVPRIILKNFKKISIPLPSLSNQAKIVELLDTFENILSNVDFGIPAEIATRRKQYEYYRNKLLTFKEVNHESI
jgi:type I restriction enzyme, S subunit